MQSNTWGGGEREREREGERERGREREDEEEEEKEEAEAEEEEEEEEAEYSPLLEKIEARKTEFPPIGKAYKTIRCPAPGTEERTCDRSLSFYQNGP